MSKTTDVFIALLRSAVTGTDEEIDFGKLDHESIYSLSKLHDLSHIIYSELKKYGQIQDSETDKKFRRQFDTAVYRYIKREAALSQIREILENAGIPFVLLKGAYLMDLYPEKWMRTSSDIDILVEEPHYQDACGQFEKNGWKRFAETAHDASYNTPDGYHVELHYTLIEEDLLPDAAAVLERVWDYCDKKENDCEYVMRDEMICFYHIAHTAKHFKYGGCGVRFFIDLWLIKHKLALNSDGIEKLLCDGGLKKFEEQAVNLSENWFSCAENADVIPDFEKFVLNGGIYGTAKQKITIQRKAAKSRVSYYLNRAFPPHRMMKYGYPILRKMPVFLPLCWIVRWFRLLNPGIRKKAKEELSIEKAVNDDDVCRAAVLIKQLEIQ